LDILGDYEEKKQEKEIRNKYGYLMKTKVNLGQITNVEIITILFKLDFVNLKIWLALRTVFL